MWDAQENFCFHHRVGTVQSMTVISWILNYAVNALTV